MKVPGFIVEKVYVKGSLRNVPGGFQFQLDNKMGNGQARKVKPLTVDGVEMLPDKSFLNVGEERRPFNAVTEDAPFSMAVNQVSTIEVEGVSLAQGARKVVMGIVLTGLGEMEFEFVDEVRE